MNVPDQVEMAELVPAPDEQNQSPTHAEEEGRGHVAP